MRAYWVILALVVPSISLQGSSQRDPLFAMRVQLENCESSLITCQERMRTQEASIDALRHEVESALVKSRDIVKGSSTQIDDRIAKIEKNHKEIAADLNQIKELTNASVKEVNEYQKRIAKLESIVDKQSKNLIHLETALTALTTHLSQEATDVAHSGNSYTVQGGDCLGSIAKKTGSSIKALKEANRLMNDKVVVGQTLVIP